MTDLEWQVAAGSRRAHVIDKDMPTKRRPERGWRSGPRALCGRYPQRNMEYPWWSWPVEGRTDEGLSNMLQFCVECAEKAGVKLDRYDLRC